jgi:Flp pilus assembly protein TadG
MVEFAIVAPLLLIFLFGIIEFGLLFGQKLDVSQGAREGARLAAVNFQSTGASSGATQATEIVAATCGRMEVAQDSSVTIDLSAGIAVGDSMTFTIETPARPITGVFDPWLQARIIRSDVVVRLEQAPTFTGTVQEACP